jgi:hypothetical protein
LAVEETIYQYFGESRSMFTLWQAIPQLLDTLRQMIGRSSKLAVQLVVGGLVPWLLAMIEAAAPIIRVKLLEIIR